MKICPNYIGIEVFLDMPEMKLSSQTAWYLVGCDWLVKRVILLGFDS